jgi:nucleoid-associated protein YgaU
MEEPMPNPSARAGVSRNRARLATALLLLSTTAAYAEPPTAPGTPDCAALEAALAEAKAENAALARELERLSGKQQDLEAQAAELPPLQRALRQSRSAAERAEQAAEQLREEIAQLEQQRQAAAQNHTAQLTAAELRLREHKDRLGGVEARIQGLERQLAQREAQIERLKQAEARQSETRARSEAHLAERRANPPQPGSEPSAAEARAQAQGDAELLARLVGEGQGINNPRLWQQVREAENALHRHQFQLAQAEGARTVYRVRPGESLGRVSLFVYGNEQDWTRIFDANRHLLDDPERVLPGLTLVIP